MPLGSSSDAPVISPGPRIRRSRGLLGREGISTQPFTIEGQLIDTKPLTAMLLRPAATPPHGSILQNVVGVHAARTERQSPYLFALIGGAGLDLLLSQPDHV